ncbi:DUF960 family protein [Paenibacillus sp. GYB004]|uniref:DUF960 family protein n=1 Tax=Paenibacillus sp. GYB004 TaxID=2994393 RepID=UPI002F96A0ED
MFPRHSRYVSHLANETLPPDIQSILWSIVDRDLAEGRELDYLQVFTLSIVRIESYTYQRIRQKQEKPERKRIHDISGVKVPLSGVTVWIIDSDTYCTMLLPEDY